MKKKNGKVFVGMSGGVDSSVLALLLKESGYDVVGVFMRCFNIDGCAEKDAEDARRVAEKLNIPFYVWDFEEEYKKRVVEYMIDGYRRGLTPNPDVMCNKQIKFGLFLEKALALGADCIATGHYVRIRENSLFEAKDKNKDQSYFLWTLTQAQLKHCLFPIGDYLKPEVREIARKAGLPTADKKDSQGICFLGKVTLADFLRTYIPEKRGEVLSASGNKIGEHSGAHFYTIGQRHLGVGVKRQASSDRKNFEPIYITEKNVETNTLTVAEGSNHPALYKKEAELTDVNLISSDLKIKSNESKVFARVRYRQPLAPAKLTIHNSSFKLVFDKPQKFVAAGQSAVFYEISSSTGSGLKMLGGGVIV